MIQRCDTLVLNDSEHIDSTIISGDWWRLPPPPPNLVLKDIKNTLSPLITSAWGFLCATVTGLILLLLQPNAVSSTVTTVNAITSSGVTAHD